MRAVNLLPKDDGRQRSTKEKLPFLVGGGSFLFFTTILLVLSMSAAATVSQRETALEQTQAELSLVPPPPPPQTPQEAGLVGQQQARVGALSSALSRRVAFDRVLRQLSLVLPSDVWLTSLSARAPSSPAAIVPTVPSATAAPTGLSIEGYTYSHDSVARLLSRLQVVPDLRNVQLQQSSLNEVGSQSIVQFTINADIRTAGPVT